MDNRMFECIAQREHLEKIRESKNVRAILATKKQAIYLNNYPSYHGKTCTKKACIVDNPKETFINDESKENIPRKKIASVNRENSVIVDGRVHFSDRSSHFTTSSRQQERLPTLLTFDGRIDDYSSLKRKIPRPANAFMLFANEWRKKLASENPRESNKDISVRLGILWKNMAKDVKERYFALAREVDAEHKRKYPDYVYNPKEARLRKAMREQNRESSRRSILQNAIAGARNGVIVDSPTTTTTTTSSSSAGGGYLDQQQPRHHLDCGGSNVPNFQGDQFIESQQHSQHHQHHQRPMQEPWFQASKSGYVTRGMDWYATSSMDSDVEQRSRLVMQQRHQQQQRVIEKPSKEATRSQAAAAAATVAAAAAVECASAFSTGGYSPAFKDNPNLERELNRRQEVSGNYGMAEFPDGQKWHPYQNNGNLHQHARASHLSSQIGNVHRANGQETGFHGQWGQFCHGMPPHAPGMVRNVAIRGVRQAIFLRDRTANRHCNFPENPSRVSYASRKHDVEDARSSYPPQEHEMSLEPIVGSTPVMPRRREKHEESKWEANPVPNSMSFDGLVSSTTIPEAYSSRNPPRVFPFPSTCRAVLKTPAEDLAMKRHDELYSRSVHDDYYWFAKQAGHTIMKFSNSDAMFTWPQDCVHRVAKEHNFRENATFTHISNIEALIRRYGGKCCIFVNEEDHGDDRKFVIIGTDNNTNSSSSAEDEEDDDNDIKNEKNNRT